MVILIIIFLVVIICVLIVCFVFKTQDSSFQQVVNWGLKCEISNKKMLKNVKCQKKRLY